MARFATYAAMAALLALAAGCDADPSGVNTADVDESGTPTLAAGERTSLVRGTLTVDSSAVVQARGTGGLVRCTAPGLAGGLGKAADPVVIQGPDGTEVARGNLGFGEPVTARRSGRVVPGTCAFAWTARLDEPLVAGVHVASVPELDVEAQFTRRDADGVVLSYR